MNGTQLYHKTRESEIWEAVLPFKPYRLSVKFPQAPGLLSLVNHIKHFSSSPTCCSRNSAFAAPDSLKSLIFFFKPWIGGLSNLMKRDIDFSLGAKAMEGKDFSVALRHTSLSFLTWCFPHTVVCASCGRARSCWHPNIPRLCHCLKTTTPVAFQETREQSRKLLQIIFP